MGLALALHGTVFPFELLVFSLVQQGLQGESRNHVCKVAQHILQAGIMRFFFLSNLIFSHITGLRVLPGHSIPSRPHTFSLPLNPLEASILCLKKS